MPRGHLGLRFAEGRGDFVIMEEYEDYYSIWVRDQGDLVSRLIMGLTWSIAWLIGVFNLFTEKAV